MTEFDQFQVPPLLLKELYKENLVALKDHQQENPGFAEWKDHARGQAVNGLLVLVNYPTEKVIGSEDFTYLANILHACKRAVDESLVLNMSGFPAGWYSTWIPESAPRYVWMIGIEPAQISLPARFPAFQVQLLGDITYMWSPPLSQLKEKEPKTKLWNALKQMFRIA
jgi:hypothetical protein